MLFLLFPQTLTQGVIHNMNDSSGESLIQIKNLTAAVRLNNGDTLVTVNNASIELKRGNSYAIVGKSGSGKTSLISIIGLLNRSYKGEYLYDGVSVSALICSLGSKSNSSRYDDVNYIIKTIDESDYLSR